jgi:hypothetical protein
VHPHALSHLEYFLCTMTSKNPIFLYAMQFWQETLESLKTHARYQRKMFDQAVKLVRPGGVIVYSTWVSVQFLYFICVHLKRTCTCSYFLAGSWANNISIYSCFLLSIARSSYTLFACPQIEHKELAHDTIVQLVINHQKFIIIGCMNTRHNYYVGSSHKFVFCCYPCIEAIN